MKRNALILAAAVLIAAMLSGCMTANKNSVQPSAKPEGTPGDSVISSAPSHDTAFVHFTATDLDGQTADESIFAQYEVTFINYWATWCPYCVQEFPELEEMYLEYRDRVGFISICDDATDDATIQVAKNILANTGVTFTCLTPFEESAEIFGGKVYSYPTSIVVDKNGAPLSASIEGPYPERYIEAIEEALAAVN